MSSTDRDYAILAILCGVVGFSLKSIFIKLAYMDGIDIISLMGYRMLISMPFFILSYLFFRKNNRQSKCNMIRVLLCSVLYYISSLFDIIGLRMVSVNIERMILFTIPIFVILISSFLLKKKHEIGVYVAAFLSWIGVGVSFYSTTSDTPNSISVLGVFFIIASSASYASYLILSYEEVKKTGVIVFNSQVMSLSCVLSIIPLIFTSGVNSISSPVLWRYPLLLSIISTVIPSFFMMYGIKRCGATVTAISNNTGPFITMACGYLILHESVSYQDMAGMLIVLFSVLYVNRKKLQ